jgi:AGZA family xanthine/uracil permease-like MFS transporter
VSAGGRTGLASVVTAALFLLALFFYPLVRMIGGGYQADGVILYPVVAPVLVLVGVMMMEGVRQIRWDDLTEAIPAFLTLLTMPLAVSITDGIAFGFISFALLKLATGRARELDWLGYVFAGLFLLRYVFHL